MNISEYAEKARSTAIYPKEFSFLYPSLGLVGEVGETLDKLTMQSQLKVTYKLAITMEISDCLWYIINIAADIGLSIQELVDALTGGLRADNFTEVGTQLKIRDDQRSPLIKISVYAGRIAEVAKKMIRDNDGVLMMDKAMIVRDSLVEVWACLYEICGQQSINMDDVARANIVKLFSRRDRSVLQGSGDDR